MEKVVQLKSDLNNITKQVDTNKIASFKRGRKHSVKLKKSDDYTPVEHTKEWFRKRVGKMIFRRVITSVDGLNDACTRSYVEIASIAHADALYTYQNVSGYRYFQK